MVCLEDAHKMSLTAQKWETYRFTSKEFDRETGLYYFGARYYEPKLSRWMSADPAGFELINPMNSDGKPRSGYLVIEATNWYSYVSNNPVKYVDPTGMASFNIKRIVFAVQGFFSNTQALGTPETNKSGSMFRQQFASANVPDPTMSTIAGVAGLFSTTFAILGAAAAVSQKQIPDEIVSYYGRKAFIVGATNEINRITKLLEDSEIGPDARDNLKNQLDLLSNELKMNIEFDEIESKERREFYYRTHREGLGGKGGRIPPYVDQRPTEMPDTSSPIDYLKDSE